MIHDQSDVQSLKIGSGSRVWQFTIVLAGAVVGEDCNICSHCFIENDVVIGDRVTIKCGVQLWDGLRIEDDVFIGPNVTFTNDKNPRSQQYPNRFLQTVVKKGASIGANATILPGVTIGAKAMVGAGAVVTRSVPAEGIVMGNPAELSGYTNLNTGLGSQMLTKASETVKISGVSVCELQHIPDIRGNLCVAELGKHLSFDIKRIFFVYGVPNAKVRGEHAHKECHQYLMCIKGSVHVIVDDGSVKQEIVLDQPNIGLHLEPGVWGVQYKYSEDAILTVLASHPYDENDYLRNYEEFLEWKLNKQ